MIDEQKLRWLAHKFLCEPVSRSITEVEQGGEAILALLDELQSLRSERTAWRVTAENAEKELAALKASLGYPVAYANPDDMLCADTSFRWVRIGRWTNPVYAMKETP